MAVAAALLLAVVGTGTGLLRTRAALAASRVSEADAVAQKQVATRLLSDVTAARAAAESQSHRAQAANEFMRNMLGSAGGANADLKVSEVLDRATMRLENLKDQPELELDGRLTLAHTYRSLRQYNRAIVNFDRALELSRRMSGPESEQTLQITAEALGVPRPPGDAANPEPMAREAVTTARRVLGPQHPVTLEMLNTLGSILTYSKKNAAAEQIFRDLTSRIHEPGYVAPPAGSARFFNNLANAVDAQGRMFEAEQLRRQAIEVARQEQQSDPIRTAAYLNNLARTLRRESKDSRFGKGLSRCAVLRVRGLGRIASANIGNDV